MGSGIEALYIFNHQNTPILQHVYRSRPPLASTLLSHYLGHPKPRPPLIYIPDTAPPTLLFSLLHSQLLFLAPTSVDTEPLLVLEFLRRVVDVLEEFLGAPLLESKIEGGYDVVAQLLGEMCDAGIVSNTEPNALRDAVDVPGWMGKLLGGVGLPGSSLTPSTSMNAFSSQTSSLNSTIAPQLPWRRANVRHTSNEIYVDFIESLSVLLAPSGRPLSAFANGTIACTSKLSGVPDLLLSLSSPSGRAGIERVMELPTFHPCVRLARWKEKPGTLSFVPPDGRFVLAGYEVDLLPPPPSGQVAQNSNLHLPVTVEVRTGLGPAGADFEVQLSLSNHFPGATNAALSGVGSGAMRSGLGSRLGTSSPGLGASASQPILEDVVVHIPLPHTVRNVTDLHPSRGQAHYIPTENLVEWHCPSKDPTNSTTTATLRCTVLGQTSLYDAPDDLDHQADDFNMPSAATNYAYDETVDAYQSAPSAPPENQKNATSSPSATEKRDAQQKKKNATTLMPSAVTVSFQVRNWLPSGIKVDSLVVNNKVSRGAGDVVKPYKGVKYVCVSRRGCELRC